jgi:hypothetical protein
MVRALDVIWIFDELINPPGPKMVVCVEPDRLFFFRINLEPKWGTHVLLKREPHHQFLSWDSYLECRGPLDLDEYIIDESIGRRGVIGSISAASVPEIVTALEQERTLNQADKDVIKAALARFDPGRTT